MIIALTGLAGSGKNTVADMIPGAQVAFAEPLKRFCAEVFGFTHDELYGPSEARERPSKTFTRPNGEPLTPRYALQTLGTEWGRNCDLDVWAKSGIARAQAAAAHTFTKRCVITDCRFANEAAAVRAIGGQVWRVNRHVFTNPGVTHASEREIYGSTMTELVTREIDNVGSLDDLAHKVRVALLSHSDP